MSTEPLFLLIGLATTVVIGIGKGAFGGGLAMLGVPLRSLVVDPVAAAIIVAPLVAVMDVFALGGGFGRATWSGVDLAWLLPGLALGIAAGAVLVAAVDPRLVGLAIAAVTLAFTGHYFLKGRRQLQGAMAVSPLLAILAGAASGFATFVAHSGGPPVAMYLLRRGLDKTRFAGTTIALFAIGNALKLPPYLALGWNRPGVLAAAAVLVPAAPIGVWLGLRLHRRLPQARLFFWCYVLLGLAALKLLVDCLRDLTA